MPFTVKDFQSLLRLLERQPAWKDALRATLLGEEFLELPAIVRDLLRAQRATNRQIRALAKAQARTEERLARVEEAVARLAEAQVRTEERVGRLEERVDRLEEAMARLAEAQARTEETVRVLVVTVDGLRKDVEGLKRDVGRLKGDNLERYYRERSPSCFQRILRRIRVIDAQRLGLLLDDAVEAGRITPEERADALEADVVVVGQHDGEEVYLVVEVSATVTAWDVERAKRRAAVLEKATEKRALPAVAGEELAGDPDTQREVQSVWRILDGRAEPPT